MADDLKKCKWCEHALGTTSSRFVYCQNSGEISENDAWCDAFVRAPGADDDKE